MNSQLVRNVSVQILYKIMKGTKRFGNEFFGVNIGTTVSLCNKIHTDPDLSH